MKMTDVRKKYEQNEKKSLSTSWPILVNPQNI